MTQSGGFRHIKGYFSKKAQKQIADDLHAILAQAPLFQPTMPRSGKPFSVRMSNCGALGWVSDKEGGYRYQARHPVTQEPWPAMPDWALKVWEELADYDAAPEAALINWYDAKAKMGLHQDRDEEDFGAPVLSLSLGDRARFRLGGKRRSDPTRSMELASGDVVVLGGAARLAYHGIDRVIAETGEVKSPLFLQGGRVNVTLRRVTRPKGSSKSAD